MPSASVCHFQVALSYLPKSGIVAWHEAGELAVQLGGGLELGVDQEGHVGVLGDVGHVVAGCGLASMSSSTHLIMPPKKAMSVPERMRA